VLQTEMRDVAKHERQKLEVKEPIYHDSGHEANKVGGVRSAGPGSRISDRSTVWGAHSGAALSRIVEPHSISSMKSN
jgi:hypothetical protein